MAKINFTSSRIDSFKCPDDKKQAFLWDTRAPGLGLRTTPQGSKSYIFQGKLLQQSIRVTIGDPRAWSIEQAQDEARRLQRLIDGGQDPRAERTARLLAEQQRKAEAKRQYVTLGEAWEVYIRIRRPKWSERHYLDHVRFAEPGGRPALRGKKMISPGPLAPLLSLTLPELTRPTISAWLEKEVETRAAQARLAFSALCAFITWCESQEEYAGMADLNICTNRLLKEIIPRQKPKQDCLQREQLVSWFQAVLNLENPVHSAYLQALLLTGARREEMAALRWDEVDFQWKSLKLADKIEEDGREIPLTPYLASLLLDLKIRNETPPPAHILARWRKLGKEWQPSEWVFSSPASADGKIAEPRISHNKALKAAGLPHLTLHGLRRSFGTLAEWVECPTGAVAQIMGHKPSAIAEKHYIRRPLDLLRVTHEKIETWILTEAKLYQACDF